MKEPKFTPDFFYDEVRNGFYVPEMMKRFWAAQLIVLYEIVKICNRHSIPWYADMGTLLGAIRHKGFVPWDDDIDISMNRDDWNRFFKYAKDELPEGFFALTVWTNEEYGLSVGRVTGSNCINTNRAHMEKFGGCPYCAGVDIYPIDRIYKDAGKEQKRKNKGKAVKRAFDLIASQGLDANETRKELAGIERDNHVVLHRNSNIGRELILLFEELCMECREDDYEQVAVMYTWIVGDWANCPRDLYEESIEVPFENTTLMASAKFDQLLTIYYHDYMTIVKGGGVHEYPLYKDQEYMLAEMLGHNPYRYTFNKEDLHVERKEQTLRNKCFEITNIMGKSLLYCGKLNEEGDNENAIKLLTGLQELAISLGTIIENKYGETCSVVKELEQYCELLYQASQQWTNKADTDLRNKLICIRNSIESLLNSKKEILFLPCRTIWWDTMKPLYESVIKSDNTDVYIMPTPYYDRNPYGESGEQHDESDYFKSMEGYTENYDIEKKHPDIIVIQVPYDGYSCAMTVPERYYSDNLLLCCDELWYIPCFDPDPPEDENDKATKTISILVEQPTVINADKVILNSEKMRSFYIECLSDMAGKDTKEYWENKIQTLSKIKDFN